MSKKAALTFISGPILLLLSMVLLFAKTAALLGRPVWVVGMILSTLLSAFITFLAAREFYSREKGLADAFEAKGKEAANIRSTLEETQEIYRGKVDQLEQEIANTEKEIALRDEEIGEMKVGYEKLYDETSQAKTQASHFHTSLEDALTELRQMQQIQYLERESDKHIPKDLVQQHRQLREQFEEKSLVLEQTRRRLFAFEGHLLALKKERGIELLNEREEQLKLIETLKELDMENSHLEEEVAALEEVASAALLPKKKPSSTAKKDAEQVLELQFDK